MDEIVREPENVATQWEKGTPRVRAREVEKTDMRRERKTDEKEF